MSEFVAHEVEVAAVDGCQCNEANHLVEGDAAVGAVVLVALFEVPVHVGINEAEDDGLVAHECLVVALAIGDGSLVGPSVFHFPKDGTGFPVFIA